MRNAGRACAVCESVEKLLALKPDILVETASPAALREWAVPTLKNGTSIVTLSIGALADDAFYREVSAVAKENGTRIYIASGATGGFDVLRTAALMGPEAMHVTIQSTPGFKGDTQRVEIENEQVRAVVDVYSATAEIAGWSVVNTLLNIVSPVVF